MVDNPFCILCWLIHAYSLLMVGNGWLRVVYQQLSQAIDVSTRTAKRSSRESATSEAESESLCAMVGLWWAMINYDQPVTIRENTFQNTNNHLNWL